MDTEARFGKKGKSLHYATLHYTTSARWVGGVGVFFISGLGWRVGGGVWGDDERKVERGKMKGREGKGLKKGDEC